MTWGAIGGAAIGLVGNALMSSGGSSGSTTTSSSPWSVQTPYLQGLFNNAQSGYQQYASNPASLFTANQVPLQTSANSYLQNLLGGYNPGASSSAYNSGLEMLSNVLSGGYSPNVSGNNVGNLNTLASGQSSPLLTQMAQYGTGVSGNNVGGLASMANGQMLNNPYMQGMANAAGTNLINQYQTATAPQISSQMEGSGRYGSGAQANAQAMAENALATQLGNAQNNLYGGMYQTNMGNMLGAGTSLNSQMTSAGQSNASNMLNAALGASGQTLQAGLGLNNSMTNASQANASDLINAYQAAAGLVPNYLSAGQGTALNAFNLGTAGQNLQQQINMSPLELLQAYQGLVGGQGYGSNVSQPYFTNPLANVAGGAMLGQQLAGGFSGLSNGTPTNGMGQAGVTGGAGTGAYTTGGSAYANPSYYTAG